MIDEKRLWLKLSGSINYYLRTYERESSDTELLEDYLYYTFDEENGKYIYLDKQSLEHITISKELIDKVKNAFMERLQKKRAKEPVIKANKIKQKTYKNNVIDFMKYKK